MASRYTRRSPRLDTHKSLPVTDATSQSEPKFGPVMVTVDWPVAAPVDGSKDVMAGG